MIGRAVIKYYVIGLTIALLLFFAILFGGRIRTVSTVKCVEGSDMLYTMEYRSDYDTDDFLEGEFPSLDLSASMDGSGAEVFNSRNTGGERFMIVKKFLRSPGPMMIVRNCPKRSYSSISLCDLSMLGYSATSLPSGFLKAGDCADAVFAPVDAVNEMGLGVSMISFDLCGEAVPTLLLRLLLDCCAGVMDAIECLDSLSSSGVISKFGAFCFLVADTGGNGVIVSHSTGSDLEYEWRTADIYSPLEDDLHIVLNQSFQEIAFYGGEFTCVFNMR